MMNLTSYSISGSSRIEGVGDVAYFNANYSQNGDFNFNMSVSNRREYEGNKVQVDEDFEQFKLKADEYAELTGIGNTDD